MSSSQRVVSALFAVLIAAVGAAFLVRDAGTTPIFALIVVGLIAAGAVYYAASGAAGGENVAGIAEAIRKATEGQRARTPEGASPEIARLYAAIDEIAEAHDTSADERKKLGDERKKLAARVEATEGLHHSLEDVVRRLRDGIGSQLGSVDETARVARELANSIREVSQHAETLAS
ncbi:MAG TPA: hypothetical protein VLM85_04105, partial [Polyangiaceae bacterium]|nr:hypothetical protein [Polyangiaceae bacterium]